MHNGEGYERLRLVRDKNTVRLIKTEVQGKKSQGKDKAFQNEGLTIR